MLVSVLDLDRDIRLTILVLLRTSSLRTPMEPSSKEKSGQMRLFTQTTCTLILISGGELS